MTTMSPDHELVNAYAKEGSETAFRALVRRHVDLVYGTALRQVGDPGLAEEIAQNVFVALARKAPRLAGRETLAGWLHRTTILEAKARIRAELRRQRREETAAEMATLEHDGTSPLAALVPLLDEALLHLRESDRLALMLRFLEERSLQEVGQVLGVDEDAARKRVARALDRLTGFFRQRGIAVPAGVGAITLLNQAAIAAPPLVLASVTEASLAAAAPATAVSLLCYHVMAMTKTQTAVVCVLLAALPLGWQWRAEARLKTHQDLAKAQVEALQQEAGHLDLEIQRTRQSLAAVQSAQQSNSSRLAALQQQTNSRTARRSYEWDDSSPLLRVPKQFLSEVNLSAIQNRKGHLRDVAKQLLQLTDSETQQIEAAISQFLADYQAAQAPYVTRIRPREEHLNGRSPQDTRVFEVKIVPGQFEQLRQTMLDQLRAILGPERFPLFAKALDGWVPMPEGHTRMSNHMAIFDFDRYEIFYAPKPGDTYLSWSIKGKEGNSMASGIDVDDLPGLFRPHLEDWIQLAQSKPAPAPVPEAHPSEDE
jgi:RNA polymerase sigma factor (sigma-70 family)